MGKPARPLQFLIDRWAVSLPKPGGCRGMGSATEALEQGPATAALGLLKPSGTQLCVARICLRRHEIARAPAGFVSSQSCEFPLGGAGPRRGRDESALPTTSLSTKAAFHQACWCAAFHDADRLSSAVYLCGGGSFSLSPVSLATIRFHSSLYPGCFTTGLS